MANLHVQYPIDPSLYDLVKIKSGNYHAWSYNQNDQPYPMCLEQDLIGTVIGSMNDYDGDHYNLAEYWLQYDREFMEGLGRREDWSPSELYLVQTTAGLVITLRVEVLQKADPDTFSKRLAAMMHGKCPSSVASSKKDSGKGELKKVKEELDKMVEITLKELEPFDSNKRVSKPRQWNVVFSE